MDWIVTNWRDLLLIYLLLARITTGITLRNLVYTTDYNTNIRNNQNEDY